MEINISSLDKKVFKIALEEEIERETMTQNIVKNQIENGFRFEKDEEAVAEIDRLAESFKKISRKRKPVFEITDEEHIFLERLTKNQTIISNERIKDWEPGGTLREYIRGKYFEENPKANDKDFEETCKEMIQYDIDLKECMRELSAILGIEYNPELTHNL